MFVSRTPLLLQWLFPSLLWRVKTNQKEVFLTFDDGPVPEVTPWVLDLLKMHNIKATFFCVGENVVKYPDIFKRIIEEGHVVGNHTFNHMKYSRDSNESYKESVLKASEVINGKLFRPPHGLLNFSMAKWLLKRYKVVMWDVLTADYDKKRSGEMCFETVKNKVRKGSVIVFHDSLKAELNLKTALPLSIHYLLEKNWKFNIITEKQWD